MGNRAIVKPEGRNVGVYLHWNGGIDSVTAFLKYCELKGYRSFEDPYGLARFCQVVGNFFGGGLSIGIEVDVDETDEYAEWIDNGIYVVKGWKIVRRIGGYQSREGYELNEMLHEIDIKQPLTERLGDFLDAEETDISDIKVGDIVFVHNYHNGYEKHRVVGIGEDKVVNGRNVKGFPYVDKYGHDPSCNINNYIFEKTRVWKG